MIDLSSFASCVKILCDDVIYSPGLLRHPSALFCLKTLCQAVQLSLIPQSGWIGSWREAVAPPHDPAKDEWRQTRKSAPAPQHLGADTPDNIHLVSGVAQPNLVGRGLCRAPQHTHMCCPGAGVQPVSRPWLCRPTQGSVEPLASPIVLSHVTLERLLPQACNLALKWVI